MREYRRPLTLGRLDSMRGKQRPTSRQRSSDIQSRGQARCWASVFFSVLAGAIICTPYLVLGPHVVFSVNISQRDNAENDAVETAGVGAVHGDTEVGEIPMATMLRRQAKTLFTGNSPGPLSTGKSQDMTSTTIVPGEVTRRTDTPREGDLCMGMAVGISAAQLVTFVASFRENSPLADLVLFFEAPASARFREIIEKYGVVALEIDRDRLEPAFLRRYHPSSARWVLMHRFLDVKGGDYEHVLIVNVGDTFFQADPFNIVGDPGIYSFMQDQLIGQSSPTSGWIKDCLGSSALSEVADEPIIYSSVTLATSRYATEYAREMSEGLSSALFQACETPGVEKGLHNYLLYTGDTTRLLRFDQTSGPVIDIQDGEFTRSEMRVANLAGRKVPIVYGYRGNAEIKADAFSRYVYWQDEEKLKGSKEDTKVNQKAGLAVKAPMIAPDAVADACGKYTLRESVDLFRAKCDLADTGVDSLDDCCAACEGRTRCQAFSYDGHAALCYMKNCNQPGGVESFAAGVTSGYK